MLTLSLNLSGTLNRHPKINQLAELLEKPLNGQGGLKVALGKQQSPMLTRNVSRAVAISSLLTIWNYAREFAEDGVFKNVEVSYLDMLTDYPGFGDAMIASGWAVYDNKKKCITLAGVTRDQKVVAVKKSPGATRQQRYREKQKLKALCIKNTMAVLGARGINGTSRPDPSSVNICLKKNENGEVYSYGTIVMGGKAIEVSCLALQNKPRCMRNNRQGITIEHSEVTERVTLADSGVTETVTDHVTVADSCVTRGVTGRVTFGDSGVTETVTDHVTVADSCVTRGVTGRVTFADSGVTQGVTGCVTAADSCVTLGVTDRVTFGDSGVTQGVTDCVTAADSCVTLGVTDRVTFGDSGVTQGVTGCVTAADSCVTLGVTDRVTFGDSGVTQGVTEIVTPGVSVITVSDFSTRVLPSRAHTRFCFLRSKYINKILNKTHTAREVIHSPAEFSKPKTDTGSASELGVQTHYGADKPLAEILSCPTSSRFNALLNVTQSVTLTRKGNEAICVNRNTPPAGSRRGQCRSQTTAKFAMAAGWQPSGEFLDIARRCGHELAEEPSPAEIAEFITYWSEEGDKHTQRQWESKLARCIAKGRKRLPRRKPAARDFMAVSSMDYTIPEGFRGA